MQLRSGLHRDARGLVQINLFLPYFSPFLSWLSHAERPSRLLSWTETSSFGSFSLRRIRMDPFGFLHHQQIHQPRSKSSIFIFNFGGEGRDSQCQCACWISGGLCKVGLYQNQLFNLLGEEIVHILLTGSKCRTNGVISAWSFSECRGKWRWEFRFLFTCISLIKVAYTSQCKPLFTCCSFCFKVAYLSLI